MHDPCHSKQVTCYDWPGRQGEAARVLSSAARQVAGEPALPLLYLK